MVIDRDYYGFYMVFNRDYHGIFGDAHMASSWDFIDLQGYIPLTITLSSYLFIIKNFYVFIKSSLKHWFTGYIPAICPSRFDIISTYPITFQSQPPMQLVGNWAMLTVKS